MAVYFNNKEYKWYLLENTEKQLILLTKTNTFVVKHDKIEYIKHLKRDKHQFLSLFKCNAIQMNYYCNTSFIKLV